MAKEKKKESSKKLKKEKDIFKEKTLEDIFKKSEQEVDDKFSDVNEHHSFKFLSNALVIIILLVIFIRFYGVSQIITKEYSIVDEALPAGFDGMKVVQISDIHYGTTINETNLKKLVTKVNQLKPDIIVFTGDLVDQSINTTDKIKAEITVNLSKLEATIGKYAIASQEDMNNNDFNDLISNSGFVFLNNESKLVYNDDEEPLELVGFNDSKSHIELTSNYKIALIHEPDDTDDIINNNYNLILAGHSHGGIIRLPFVGGLIYLDGARKYHDDYYSINNTKLYISSGLGTSNINFRMFNQPSINLYRFYKN